MADSAVCDGIVSEQTPLLTNKEDSPRNTETEPSPKNLQQTLQNIKLYRHRIAASIGITMIIIGVAFGWLIKKWCFLTSLYVITQIVTTVGYGDFTVTDPLHKIAISFYVLILMVLFAYYLNVFAQKCQSVEEAKVRASLRALSAGQGSRMEMTQEVSNVCVSGILFGLALLFGTVFYANYEACTCSYGQSHVQGCQETTYHNCVETGGYVKGYVESWYMSVVTLLTIGFGDHTPRSYFGRAVGIVYMVMGVSISANFVGTISEYFFAVKTSSNFQEAMAMGEETFREIDKDGSGYLNRGEFLNFALQQYGLVAKETLQELNDMFDKMDKTCGSQVEHVTWEDIKAFNSVREKEKEAKKMTSETTQSAAEDA